MEDKLNHNKKPILKLRDLRISFVVDEQVTEVVKGLNFNLFRGTITALLGETGAGKSITGLALIGLLNAKNAHILGKYEFISSKAQIKEDINHFKLLRGKDITMIFQNPLSAFNPIRTIKDQVKDVIAIMKGSSHKKGLDQFEELMSELELQNRKRLLNSYPHQVSGGQLQRLMVALCLLQNPRILIADEPASSLDSEAKDQLYKLLIKISQKHGTAILLITHDIARVSKLATEMIVLHEGRIVESGKTEEIFSNPQDTYTKSLLNSIPSNYYQLNKERIEARNGRDVKLESETGNSILTLKQLGVHYKFSDWSSSSNKYDVQALMNVSISVHQGECLGVYGDSGSGKSTLLAAIVGLCDYSGEILFYKEDIKRFDKSRYKKYQQSVQLIFQNPNSSLNPSMSIFETLVLAVKATNAGQSKDFYSRAVNKLISDVQLNVQDINKYPYQLSGGQQQRVCIARALAYQPKILLCDEVVSALDVSIQAGILELLKHLAESYGITVLFVSHDIDVIRIICDRVIKLDKGQVVYSGSIKDI